ncbi:MAG: hypothetical protein K6U08_03235 [Firmicutes bacterium]|nr:hypothetical protein [Bacillota bacterium]
MCLETLTAGLDLFGEIIAGPTAPPVVLCTAQTSPGVHNLMPRFRRPLEYHLPGGLPPAEILRRTRPPQLSKSDPDFIPQLEQVLRETLRPGLPAAGELPVELGLPSAPPPAPGRVEVEVSGPGASEALSTDRYGWALLRVMAGRYAGTWVAEHLLTRRMFEALDEPVPEEWRFSQKFRPGAGLRGRLEKLGLFEAAPGEGSCLYRLRARLAPEG